MQATEDCLKDMAVFSRLDMEEIRMICENSTVRKFEEGEVIFFEADESKNLYLLVNGRVKLSMLSPEGKEKVMSILQEGDLFGEISLFDHSPHPVTAEVQKKARLLTLPYFRLEEMIIQKPRLALKIIENLSKKTRLLTSQVRDLVFHDAAERMASLLLRFGKDFGREEDGRTKIDLILTHQEIANLLGVSRVTVTKTINKLIDENLITIEDKNIIILDKKGLSKIVNEI